MNKIIHGCAIKYLDLFTGVGGFTKAIENATQNNRPNLRNGAKDIRGGLPNAPLGETRATCVGFSEIDRPASAIYQHHYPHHHALGNITKIDTATLPDFDLLVGGVPCQSWSVAGKRGGFEDERGNMWFQFSRILRAKQPKYFLAENVKGLLSHDGGKSMERICEELCSCGYAIDFEVLNTKNFGIPQSRQRVFIVGFRLDLLNDCQIF